MIKIYETSIKEFFLAIMVLVILLVAFLLIYKPEIKSISQATNVEGEVKESKTAPLATKPANEEVPVSTKPSATPKPKTYPKPVILYFTATPTTVVKGESVTFSWATQNATTVMLDGYYVPITGSKTIAENISFPHSHTLNVTNLGGATHKSVYITSSNPTTIEEILGICSYSAGPNASGTTCKTKYDCLKLPGGVWSGEPCG